MPQHEIQPNSSFPKAQNVLAFPFFKFPEEVLSEIFMDVVFDYKNIGTPWPPSMESDVRAIYRSLYRLLSVCSSWRGIVLARGALWSVIPIITAPSRLTDGQQPFQLSAQRSGRSKLLLAANILPSTSSAFSKILVEHGHRFHSINFTTEWLSLARCAIDALLQRDIAGALSELSFQITNQPCCGYGPPDNSEYIISENSPLNTLFSRLLRTLSAFRISGINFHWDTVKFSSHLVEIHLEDITIGYDTEIIPFLQTLSSASKLRDLKIISVVTWHNLLPASSAHGFTPVTFPKLQSLLLQNLYFNTLGYLLPMIVPSAYRVSFTLTYAGLMIHKKNDLDDDEIDGDIETDGFDTLCELLEHTIVDTLTIVDHCWLRGPRLRCLLESLSALKSLKLDSWSLDNDIWENLTRFYDAEIDSFPTLRNLYLTSVKIFDWEGFKEMIASHPFRKVVLGGTLFEANEDGPCGFRPLEDSDDSVVWLKATVPIVYMMSSTYHVREGYPNLWRLW